MDDDDSDGDNGMNNHSLYSQNKCSLDLTKVVINLRSTPRRRNGAGEPLLNSSVLYVVFLYSVYCITHNPLHVVSLPPYRIFDAFYTTHIFLLARSMFTCRNPTHHGGTPPNATRRQHWPIILFQLTLQSICYRQTSKLVIH